MIRMSGVSSVQWPAGIRAGMRVRFPHLIISDVDNSVAVNSWTPIGNPNLAEIAGALKNKSEVILISGSPYSPGDPGLKSRKGNALKLKVTEPMWQHFGLNTSPMQYLKIIEVSGRGTVTFDEAGRENIAVNSKAIIPWEMQINLAKAMAASFFAMQNGLSLDALLESSVGKTIGRLQCYSRDTDGFNQFLTILMTQVRDSAKFPGVSINNYGSEIPMALFDIAHPDTKAAMDFTDDYLERQGCRPGPEYARYYGPDFFKYALIRKVDKIAQEISEALKRFRTAPNRRNAGVFTAAGFGDSNTDDFLHLLKPPKGAAYFPFYLGAPVDMVSFPSVFTVRRRDAINPPASVEAAGFAPVLNAFREAASRSLVYGRMSDFTSVDSQNTILI